MSNLPAVMEETTGVTTEEPQQQKPNGASSVITSGEKEKPPDKPGKQKSARVSENATTLEQGRALSGAELKKKAKAEKAARRAQEKLAKPEAFLPDLKGPRKLETAEGSRSNSVAGIPGTPTAKGHQKQASASHKQIPLRPAVQQPTPAPIAEPKKEDKRVALFGHLYGQPRRTTVAGAGKDVHPAVLALGLQMSSYVVCGSNARCVATLLVFKRVISCRYT
jgi:translation initiation factor eIF-2B subunit delta